MTTQTTECPNCHTVFRVSDAQLQKAKGTVCCSQCNEIFNARAFLSTTHSYPELEADFSQLDSSEPGLFPDSFAHALEEIQNETSAGEILKNNDIPHVLEDDLAAQRTPKKKTHPVFWSFCTLVLIFTSVLQYGYFSRGNLAQDLRYRPWLVTMCKIIKCNVPHKKDVIQLNLLTRDVLIAPANNKDALIIQLSFVNKASHTQPFPILQISLSDAYGKATAMRRFRPSEYLDPSIDARQGLDPLVPVSLTLELVKPKTEASAFQIDFL